MCVCVVGFINFSDIMFMSLTFVTYCCLLMISGPAHFTLSSFLFSHVNKS